MYKKFNICISFQLGLDVVPENGDLFLVSRKYQNTASIAKSPTTSPKQQILKHSLMQAFPDEP